ncbi:N-acyl-D-amino-acid deacylase family protein, partial [Steroidobacter sp.]|uniref:N-acyl-D-amino-acid deacylase family protein n=1 Tax=Steroidobacter sp. TaxID=1978227 RepID=UPI001A3A8000
MPRADSWLIKGALVYDGNGTAGRKVDVRLREGKISKISAHLQPVKDEQVRAAEGLILVPGFIDPHSHHADSLGKIPAPASVLAQGITTVVAGVDGKANMPVSELFEQLEQSPVAVNVAAFGAHNFYRRVVMADDFRREASTVELGRMRRMLIADMDAGALGLSTGLEYDPGIYASTDEIIELANVASARGGRYSSHLRSEDVAHDAAVTEFLEIAERANIPAHMSHVKLAMSARWGDASGVLARLNQARSRGLNVTADVYPYNAWQAPLDVLLPERNFDSPAAYQGVLATIAHPQSIRIAEYAPEPALVGKTLQEIAQARGVEPDAALMDLMQTAIARRTLPWGIVSNISEEDIRTFMAWPYASICSDGKVDDRHPRGQGAFPRVLARYVREQGVLSLQEALRRMTSLSA